MSCRWIRLLPCLVLITASLFWAGCETTSTGPTAQNPRLPEGASAAQLRPGDTLGISLQGIPDPSQHNVQIDDSGLITLPYIGGIEVVGLTTSQLSRGSRRPTSNAISTVLSTFRLRSPSDLYTSVVRYKIRAGSNGPRTSP